MPSLQRLFLLGTLGFQIMHRASGFCPPSRLLATMPNTALSVDATSGIFWVADAISDPQGTAVAAAAATAGVNPSIFNHNLGDWSLLDWVKNVAVAVTALTFLSAGLLTILGAVLVPAGAQQLEIECTALIPDTWREYLGRLEEGQEMKDRPDLMVELGLLLNKCKADRMQMVCVEAQLAPDLWTKYQNELQPEQEMQDRPDLLARLATELSQRAGQVLKEHPQVCPPAKWAEYQELAGNTELIDRPGLMEDLAKELGYPDLVGACTACLMQDRYTPPAASASGESGSAVVDAEVVVATDDRAFDKPAIEDATTISGITEIRRNTNQWDDDDE